MKLSATEFAYVRLQGLCIAEKCDRCGNLLNQSWHYTVAGTPGVFCSAPCRDSLFFVDRLEARKHSTPGKCVYCGAGLTHKRRGSMYCDEKCRKAFCRSGPMGCDGKTQKSLTTTYLDQVLTKTQIGR